jgi:hypothetical protein
LLVVVPAEVETVQVQMVPAAVAQAGSFITHHTLLFLAIIIQLL